MSELKYEDRQIFRQEPDCYSGPDCGGHRPRWMTSYPKEGDEEDGEVLKLEIDAKSMPPGSRVIIEVPCCPKCGDPADMNEPRSMRIVKGKIVHIKKLPSKWPNCRCPEVMKNRLIALVILFLCSGCESYKKTGWYTPDSFNYTYARSRLTGEETDYVGFTWQLK